VALIATILIAWPLVAPPELTSISAARKTVDFSTLPALDRFIARDGSSLAYRHYAPTGPAVDRIAVVVHGSSGSSGTTIHALSQALAQHGVQTYAIDIRGHGASGTRGDIGYAGQLQDDLADLVATIRKTNPTAPLTLIGHSSGGGFALRMAGSPIQTLFARTVLLAPYLGYDAPTSQPNSGGWANADVPRFIALSVLRGVGLAFGESLPTLAFAVPAQSTQKLTSTYSYRLMRDFATSGDFRKDLAAATKPIAVFSGDVDELMFADKYQDAFKDRASVRLIDGINHMGIVSDPRAIAIIANDVATAKD
jgi:alpha-beta hydrolase superfamily lysophospholipase